MSADEQFRDGDKSAILSTDPTSNPKPGCPKDSRGCLVQQTQTSMGELEPLIEVLQRRWPLRNYVNKTNPPPVRPLPESEGPASKPFTPLRSPTAITN